MHLNQIFCMGELIIILTLLNSSLNPYLKPNLPSHKFLNSDFSQIANLKRVNAQLEKSFAQLQKQHPKVNFIISWFWIWFVYLAWKMRFNDAHTETRGMRMRTEGLENEVQHAKVLFRLWRIKLENLKKRILI